MWFANHELGMVLQTEQSWVAGLWEHIILTSPKSSWPKILTVGIQWLSSLRPAMGFPCLAFQHLWLLDEPGAAGVWQPTRHPTRLWPCLPPQSQHNYWHCRSALSGGLKMALKMHWNQWVLQPISPSCDSFWGVPNYRWGFFCVISAFSSVRM